MKRRRHLLSISQLTSQLSNKRKKCVEARNKSADMQKQQLMSPRKQLKPRKRSLALGKKALDRGK